MYTWTTPNGLSKVCVCLYVCFCMCVCCVYVCVCTCISISIIEEVMNLGENGEETLDKLQRLKKGEILKIQYSSIKFWKSFKIINIVAIILSCGLINSLNSVRDKCDIDYFLKMFYGVNKTMHLAINNHYTQLFPTQILFVFLPVVPPAQFESDIFNFLTHCIQPV